MYTRKKSEITHTRIYTDIRAHRNTPTFTYKHLLMKAHSQIYTHTYTHARMRTHTQTLEYYLHFPEFLFIPETKLHQDIWVRDFLLSYKLLVKFSFWMDDAIDHSGHQGIIHQ